MKRTFISIKKDRVLRKILKFFNENPASIDTSENIAKWIGEEESDVKKKLNYLVKKGILNKDATYVTEGYSYTQDKKLISRISEFIKEL